MKFKINYNGNYEDSINIEADTIEEIREIALSECNKRGWDIQYCWREEL